jgi:hypothetical protein
MRAKRASVSSASYNQLLQFIGAGTYFNSDFISPFIGGFGRDR